MFKTLGKIRWAKIKNGKVFAVKGCWQLAYKIDDNQLIPLASTIGESFAGRAGQIISIIGAKSGVDIYSVKHGMTIMGENGLLYKLPLEVQNLFITN